MKFNFSIKKIIQKNLNNINAKFDHYLIVYKNVVQKKNAFFKYNSKKICIKIVNIHDFEKGIFKLKKK